MAIISDYDDFRLGLRGRWGDMVFRRVYGKTVMSRKPGKQDPAKQSEARKKTRSKFKEAAAWAMMIRRDPEKKAWYQHLAKQWDLPNDYIAAVRDYLRNPAIAMQYNAVVDDSCVEQRVGEKPFSVSVESRRPNGDQCDRPNRDISPSCRRRRTPTGAMQKRDRTYVQLNKMVARDDVATARAGVQWQCRSPIALDRAYLLPPAQAEFNQIAETTSRNQCLKIAELLSSQSNIPKPIQSKVVALSIRQRVSSSERSYGSF